MRLNSHWNSVMEEVSRLLKAADINAMVEESDAANLVNKSDIYIVIHYHINEITDYTRRGDGRCAWLLQ